MRLTDVRGDEARWWTVMGAGFLAIAALVAVDLLLDLGPGGEGGASFAHVFVEAAVCGVGLAGAVAAAVAVRGLVRSARTLAVALQEKATEASRYRDEARGALVGLSRVIDQQLERWLLTSAEKETALLLLKGLSHKEIASVRQVSEATARQQAGAVYRKAGLHGRNELAAFFLEDLLLPQQTSLDAAAAAASTDRATSF